MNNTIRKKILKYETLKVELEESEILSKQYFEQFINEIFPNEFDDLIIDNSERINELQNNNDEPIISNNLRKIYKKLSLKLHPDRNINLDEEEQKENENIFKEIVQSYENGDFCNLLVRAREFRIKIPELYDEDILILENNIKTINDKLDKIKKQMSWVWCTTTNSNIKNTIRHQCKILIEKSILFDWTVEEPTDCSICLDTIIVNKIEKRLICGHIFHKHCILSWFTIKFSCPLCRRSFQ